MRILPPFIWIEGSAGFVSRPSKKGGLIDVVGMGQTSLACYKHKKVMPPALAGAG